MVRDDDAGYWRSTKRLMATVLILWFALGIGANWLAADFAATIFLGYPIGYLLAALVSPIALVGLIFWFADRQDRLDRDYGMAEED